MDNKNKSMEVLVTELNVLLKLLDHETLSSPTEEKKTSVRNLLKQLQPTVTGADYLYMNTSVYQNGTSFVESLFETFNCDLGELKDMTENQKRESITNTDAHTADTTLSKQNADSSPRSAETPPPLPTTPPPEGDYEEAAPLSPGKQPEYITTRPSSRLPNSIEDGYYEEAENNYTPTCINRRRNNSYNDSDALSSSYESYEDDEEERGAGTESRPTHQWPSDESSMLSARDCRICAFLLRKKRFGQWAKQLTVIRENRLQCFKSSKDLSPYVDLHLPQCTVVYTPKDGRRKRHELRFTLPSGDSLVLAVQSKEQADMWLRVVREVSGQEKGADESISPIIPRKTELEKRLSGEKTTSDSDSVGVTAAENTRDSGKVKRGALAAGRKITRIISFSKRKHPLPSDSRTLPTDTHPGRGYLSVLVNQVWRHLWCCVSRGSLHFHPDRGDPRPFLAPLHLHGCEVSPGLGPKHPFALRILRGATEVAALEARSSEELGRWLGVLLAETGTSTDPESLHYDYVDVETIANIRDAARHSFLWATSSSSTSTDSRPYDDVPYEGEQTEEESRAKRRSRFSSSDSGTTKSTLKHTGSNANQYGLYGKTRAQEDAKRYMREKEEMERERDRIRSSLLTLRQERREAKERLKAATENQRESMNLRVCQLEEACRGKESERVDLELRLTLVKENLKKSLAGGALGAPAETRPSSKVDTCKSQSPYYSVFEARKKPPIYTSSKGIVMQKAMEWESKKGT
ncbi:actin filament-associated protein 1-like 1 isoform X2 [Esox lucius]|uniref:Actin filament-associated protein 1-like 1 n=1 Tax=Esox lucius TaxID=8010 RepID=A0A3P8XRM5_ESOLU|nr:actin filament-associated protein 1-like 1 isoform X2 [Esox lucius]